MSSPDSVTPLTAKVFSRFKEQLGVSDLDCIPRLNYSDRGVVINLDCPDCETVSKIYDRRLLIASRAREFAAWCVRLNVGGKTKHGFPSRLTIQANRTTIMQNLTIPDVFSGDGILSIPNWGIVETLIQTNPNAKVIRFDVQGASLLPGAGLLSGANCAQSSGLTPDQWRGRDMDAPTKGKDRTWHPQDWGIFCQDLLIHRSLSEYSWRSCLYDGTRVEMVGNVRLADMNGLIRIVETLSCVPV